MRILTPFGAQMNSQIQEKIVKFLSFSEQFYVFSLISMQIQYYNAIMLMFNGCKHIEFIIFYKCAYFGAISFINKCSNLIKYSNVFTVYRTNVRIVKYISANVKL